MDSHGIARTEMVAYASAAGFDAADYEPPPPSSRARAKRLTSLRGRPIRTVCCHCARMLDEQGRWHVATTAPAPGTLLSHGLCPPCVKDLYGDLLDER